MRVPFLNERLNSFFAILLMFYIMLHSFPSYAICFLDVLISLIPKHFLAMSDNFRAQAIYFFDKLINCFLQLVFRNYAVNKAILIGFLGGDGFSEK